VAFGPPDWHWGTDGGEQRNMADRALSNESKL
jgi:hypothetical protein